MLQYLSKKILPLSVKQLKKIELDYRTKNTPIYELTSYQILSVVVRVIKLTTIEIKVTDQTQILELQFHPTSLRKGVDPQVGKYYRITFEPRKKQGMYSNSGDFTSLEITTMLQVRGNEITIHLNDSLRQKMDRVMRCSNNGRSKQQRPHLYVDSILQHQVVGGKSVQQNNSGSKSSSSTATSSKKTNGWSQVSKFCEQLGKEFDVQVIMKEFGDKYSVKEVEAILQKLSQRGLIMDLGVVYEWAGIQQE